MRQALYRAKKKQQQQQQSIQSTSTVTISRNDLRKREGLQRRRQNIAKFKLQIRQLQDANEKLQIENNQLKEKLISLTSSSSPMTTVTTTTPSSSLQPSNEDITPIRSPTSPSTQFFQHISPNAKRRATARMMVDKSDLPRGSINSVRKKFGINLSNQNLPSKTTTMSSKELTEAIEKFLNDDDNTRLTPDKNNIIDGKQVRFLLNHLINLHQKFILNTNIDCSYSTFTKHVPSYIVSPKPDNWGTCLCITCLNPQIKGERINQLKHKHSILSGLSSLIGNDLISVASDDKK
ncbi:unnamed protein product, partial [Rotaria sordida]